MKQQSHLVVAATTCLVALVGCEEQPSLPDVADTPAPEPTSALRFTDITAATGLDMTTVSGMSPSKQILEVNGTGLGLIDYDNDDDLDVFVANGATMDDPENGPGCRLYRNEVSETGSLRYTDVTTSAGIAVHRWTMGVAVGDVNADGFDDLYLTCYGPNILLLNGGDGTFADGTERAGVGDDRWGTTAAFGDLDRDGDLDLYVTNYLVFDPANPPPREHYLDTSVMGGPAGMTPQADVLYRNNGDGTFTDITTKSGCAGIGASFGLNVVIVDVDRDGLPDLIVGNDSMANFLFRNVSTPENGIRFDEVGSISGIGANADGMMQATMGMAVADVDGNGYPDLFTSNFSGDTNTMHAGVDGRFFDDHTTRYGLGTITRPYLGWGSAFADFDHDGDEDLLVVNGHVYPESTIATMGSEYEQPPLLFERIGTRFELASAASAGAWLAELHRDRGLVLGDLDRDGDLDAVISELNGPLRILRNDIESQAGNWLVVELRDTRPGIGNHRGIGSRIELLFDDYTKTRWLVGGSAFQSSQEMIAHFGWPADDTPIEIIITWPDGTEQRIEAPHANERLVTERES